MTDLSIIVPVYNGEQYLAQLLDSICAICSISIEIILVNDGSSDGSERIIKEYQSSDNRIKYFSKENGGIVNARNYGLERAEGKYLFFADQDDKIDAIVVERAVQRMEEEDADILLFSTEHFDDSGRRWACDTVYEEDCFGEHDIADRFIRKLIVRYTKKDAVSYIGHIWATVIKHDIVREHTIRFKKFLAIEDDLLFVLDALDYAKRLLTMKETGYYWRQNPSSRTRKNIYCENFVEKKRKYYEYRTNILKKHSVCTQEEFEGYCIGVRQEFMLDMLDNEAILGTKSACGMLLNCLSDEKNIEAMRSKPMCPLATRYVTEKRLMMQGKVKCAVRFKKYKYWKAKVANWVRWLRFSMAGEQ